MTKKQETPEEKQARETVEEIACTIAKLSRQVGAILSGRIKRKSLIILLAYSSKLSQGQVDSVLYAIENLEKDHLKK